MRFTLTRTRKLLLSLVAASVAVLAIWRAGGAVTREAVPQVFPIVDPARLAGGTEPIVPLPQSIAVDPKKAQLGRRLFEDVRLSGDGTVSCASCHSLEKGGADGLKRSVGIGGRQGARNTPTVFNSGFNFAQFWDGRAATLEDQVDGPLLSPDEMGSTWPKVVARLSGDASYAHEFSEIYGGAAIRAELVKDAIATFERSLVTPNSRFDRHLRGEAGALTPREIGGYRKFREYGCISCHQGVNVGGNLFAPMGVMAEFPGSGERSAAAGSGRAGFASHAVVFKVPSLRNAALTAPYLHDGSASTLEEAVEIMGKYQLGLAIPGQDIDLIVAFLRTLTGEYQGKPL